MQESKMDRSVILSLAIALAFYLLIARFFLAPPSFHPFLQLVSTLLTVVPIFVLANLIFLAVLISSGSFSLPDFFVPLAFSLWLNLLRVIIWRKTAPSGVPETGNDLPHQAVVLAGSLDSSIARQNLRQLTLPAHPQNLAKASAIAHKLRQGEQLAIDESGRPLATPTAIRALVIRSKSATSTKTDLQRAETMRDLSVLLPVAHCNDFSSPMIIPPITNAGLNDDDFRRKCEEFIAKVWETLEDDMALSLLQEDWAEDQILEDAQITLDAEEPAREKAGRL